MTTNIKELSEGAKGPLDMLEIIQGTVSELLDCAQGLDDAYFSQGMPKKEAQWFKILGGYHAILVWLQLICDLSDAMADELSKRQKQAALEAVEAQKGDAKT